MLHLGSQLAYLVGHGSFEVLLIASQVRHSTMQRGDLALLVIQAGSLRANSCRELIRVGWVHDGQFVLTRQGSEPKRTTHKTWLQYQQGLFW